MKVACTVWVRGKGSDNFKALPIDINDASVIPGCDLLLIEKINYALVA